MKTAAEFVEDLLIAGLDLTEREAESMQRRIEARDAEHALDIDVAREHAFKARAERDLARRQLETAVGALTDIAGDGVTVGDSVEYLREAARAALATIQQPQGSR